MDGNTGVEESSNSPQKTNYSNFDKEYKDYWSDTSPGFVDNPDKVVEFPYYIRSAVWYWLKNSIYTTADEGSTNVVIDKVTQAINGKAKDAAKERRDNFNELTYPAFK
jgi:predicted chitinase